MHDMSRLLLALALMFFAACAAQKNSRHGAGPAQAKTAQAPRPSGKSATPSRDHVPPAVAKKPGLPPGEVGYYMDVLQGRLQQQLDPAVVVARDNDSIVLDFSRRLGFSADAAQLDDAGRDVLGPLAKILGEYRAALILVRVSAEENAIAARRLAQLRAGAIERTLIDSGVASARIAGSAASAATRDGGTRVEIVLTPETSGD